MLSALRQEAQALLRLAPTFRPPTLRRSARADALFATDLPLLAEEDDLSAMIAVSVQTGWRVGFLPNGWMTLDHDVPPPPLSLPPMPLGETGCCLSLLLRHPDACHEPDAIRALVKADEVGPIEVEKLCRRWHQDFAARLRRHEPLPDVLPYLCAAIRHGRKEETP